MKKILPTLVICILIGVLGTIFFRTYVVKYSYSAERADLDAYYEVADENDYPVILQDQFSDYHVRKIGESYYLDLSTLRELINDRFYYSEEDMTLNYCLPDTRITAKEGSDVRTDSSGKETKENYVICVQNGEIVYVRRGDDVVSCLALMGAHRALLDMENTRINRDARNRANRARNCDEANLKKQLSAGESQAQAIVAYSLAHSLSGLPAELQEIGRLRMLHPEASLEELGQMLQKPIGKSGANHRMRKLMEIIRD